MEISEGILHPKRTSLWRQTEPKRCYLNSRVALCFSTETRCLLGKLRLDLFQGKGTFLLIAYRRSSVVLGKGGWGEDGHTWIRKEGNEPVPALGKDRTAVHPAVGVKTMRKKNDKLCAEAGETADCPVAIVICVLCLETLLQGPGCMGVSWVHGRDRDCMGGGSGCMGGVGLHGRGCAPGNVVGWKPLTSRTIRRLS